MRSLHITNGDGAAGILKASSVSGDVLPWRDPMHHGPFPADLSLDDLRRVRAAYLAGPDGDPSAAERDFALRDAHLRAVPSYDEVVLWFEHDLLDQLQILQLLDWFTGTPLPKTDLQIICIDGFPGMDRFRGIGELTPDQMASLYAQRSPVTPEMLRQAQAGWQAFRASDPHALLSFCQTPSQALPFLRPALMRHLEEFPATQTGLTRTETQLLTLVAQGVQNPVQLFLQNMDYETALYIGDWPSYRILGDLCQAGLLTPETEPFWHPPTSREELQNFRDQRLTLTALGHCVLSGGTHIAPPRDQWLGGVHIHHAAPHWTWNAADQTLALRTP